MSLHDVHAPGDRSGWQRTALMAGMAAVAALGAPRAAHAQGAEAEAPARTHTVRTGDTLWDLARAYLGNPYQWPQIHQANATVVRNPHWIYPGASLRIPGDTAALAAPWGGAPAAAPDASVFATGRPAGERPGIASEPPQAGKEVARETVRVGEYQAAPFVERVGGPVGAGSIVASGDVAGIAAASLRPRFQLYDPLFVTPPAGHTPARGDRYLSYALGPRLEGVGQVVIPTGVVVVERPGTGEATQARLVRQFGNVSLDDRLIPLDTTFRGGDVRPAAVEGGATARVVWLKGEPVLPSVQQYLVLDAAAADGLRPGDEVTLVSDRREVRRGVTIPEVEIATAQIVRVTPYAATAIVMGQAQPAIRPGTLARVTAKVP
jgi:LysM repeat protein